MPDSEAVCVASCISVFDVTSPCLAMLVSVIASGRVLQPSVAALHACQSSKSRQHGRHTEGLGSRRCREGHKGAGGTFDSVVVPRQSSCSCVAATLSSTWGEPVGP